MYINPFWVGVAATILAEIFALVVCTVVYERRKAKQEQRRRELLEKYLNIKKDEE